MADVELWALFEFTACSNRDLLRCILSFLSRKDQANLRLTNQRLRDAVAGAVDEVFCTLHNGSIMSDLTAVFPAATALGLFIRPKTVHEHSPTATEVDVFLQQIAATNSNLLQRVFHVTVDLVVDGALTTENCMAVGSVLDRCTNLATLDARWINHKYYQMYEHLRNTACFAGQGSTPAERCSSMQQQLRSIASSADFLAPFSWPAHGCLTKLEFRFPLPPQYSPLLSGGLCTASLEDLAVHKSSTSELLECSGLGHLSKLTELALYADATSQDSPIDEILHEVARLPSLVSLSVDGYVLDGASSGDGLFPDSWSQLSCLTRLYMHSCRVPLCTLSTFPTLRGLYLDCCTMLGELSQLYPLTALTRLDTKPNPSSLPGGSAAHPAASISQRPPGLVPQAWRDNLRELNWDFNWRDIHLISQLTSLTNLSLVKPEYCGELCWRLAALSNLRHLQLLHPQAPRNRQEQLLYGAGRQRPLACLKTLHPGSPGSLRQLALWTSVGPGLALTHTAAFSRDVPLAYNMLGKGWLAALVAPIVPETPVPETPTPAPPLFAQPAKELPTPWLGLRDDAALRQLLRELEGIEPGSKQTKLSLVLGVDVGAQALKRLLKAAHVFPQGSVHIGTGNSEVNNQGLLGFPLCEQLTGVQYSQLCGLHAPGLRMLQIDACSEMLDQHVQLITAAAPALRVLKLADASALTDAALITLLGCRHLEEVVVVGCQELTGAPIAMLLASLGELRMLKAATVDVGQVQEGLAGGATGGNAPVVRSAAQWSVLGAWGGAVECRLVDGAKGPGK